MNVFSKITPLLLVVLSAFLFSCQRDVSENVNQDSIHAQYRIVYDADDDKTYARAEFRFGGIGGTLLELTDPATITFEGDVLDWRALFAYYERDYAGVQDSGVFLYEDLDGNTFENSVKLGSAIAFSDSLTSISQASAFELSWDGAPIELGESVIVTLNGINEADAKIFTTSTPGATSIILEQDKLAEIGLGTGTIFIERRFDQLIQSGTSEGGLVWSRYKGKKKSIEITE